MVWSRKIEDMIYHIYRKYDSQGLPKQMERLKSICMDELNRFPELKEALTDDSSIEYFIIQMALENIR